ncbi:MAG: ferritin-like domain-containing protein, partial [Alphaproteobacteria bacterium]|nr:ferritin-like domain-containing protein [Alphaproteobacteria bacterium]
TYIYEELGLDWRWVKDAVRESFGSNMRRDAMKEDTNIFRVLIKTLLKAGIITDRTRHVYGAWIDMDELKGEGEYMIGEAIAADGIEILREINRKRRNVNLKPQAA